ncbi:sensor histidine kinase [Geobacter grbiciae]|uniref:sensor histidine kinase n=1 Tax=Geobacter grbiciae TaxID=155042 RepID=UPI001C02D564|nr:HAMP domain-containing protein [Geobacter grbiciae]
MKQFRFSFSFLILSSLSFILVLTWVLLSLISFKTAENDLLQQKSDKARLLLASFKALVPRDPAAVAPSPASTLAQRFAREGEFVGLTVSGRDGTVLYSLGSEALGDGMLAETIASGAESARFSGGRGTLRRYAPLVRDGRSVGAARLELSLKGEQKLLAQSRHLFLAYCVLDFLLLLAVGSFLLSRFIVAPVRRLLATTERIGQGDYSHRAAVGGGREIAELAESFNGMVDVLRAKQEEADRYVRSLEQANRELQEAREEALRSEKLASVGLLAAGTAHEIGTPLTSIMGYAGLLMDEVADDPRKADYLRRIERDAERIDRIVRDLLNFARPAEGATEAVDAAVLVASTLEMLELQGAFKGIAVTVDVAGELPPIVVDPFQLQQVLINLFINARDAMPDGGKLDVRTSAGRFTPPVQTTSSSLHVSGRRKEDFDGVFHASFAAESEPVPCVRIEVADTGCGIAPERLGRIFDPFFTTKEPGRGTGLGLAISARIVDSFDGRITVESSVGKGTTFVIWLPVAGSVTDRGMEQ